MALYDVLDTDGDLLDEQVELVLQFVRADVLAIRFVDVIGGAKKQRTPPDTGFRIGGVYDDRNMAVSLLDLL